MAINIRCYTLFDITKTNITNRRPPPDSSLEEAKAWQEKRNTQCNLDTITQVISIRAQPENLTDPVRKEITNSVFGTELSPTHYWTFDFAINYAQVFTDSSGDLGALFSDCNNVPMINTYDIKMPSYLDISPEQRNIYFEVL
jgi:hypothetical protein